MTSAFLYALFVILVVGPAVYGLLQFMQWQESGQQIDHERKLFIGGMMGPLALFMLILIFYLIVMVVTLG